MQISIGILKQKWWYFAGILLFVVWVCVFFISRAIRVNIKNIVNKLPRHASRHYNTRSLSQIDTIIVHHTAGPATQTPADIARYHTQPGNHICDAGCPGIGYHYMIDRSGNAYQVNELKTISYHVTNANTRSVGVCLIGNYDNLSPTTAQLKTVESVIKEINRKVGKKLSIAGHRDFANKSCPGAHIDVNEISEKVYGVRV